MAHIEYRLDHSRMGEHPSFPYNSKDFRSALTHIDSNPTTDLFVLTEPMENLQLNFWIKNLTDNHHQSSAIIWASFWLFNCWLF